MNFAEDLSHRLMILDGGMGTMIQRRGIKSLDNELLNLDRPDDILAIHRAYIDSGADIIETNSFGANRFVQKDFGLEDKAPQMAFEAARIATRAASEAARKVYVAGSVGPTGKSLSFASDADNPAYREVDFDSLKEAFREQIDALTRGGADIILLETNYDALNAKAAIMGYIESGSECPVIISVTVSDRSGRTLTGQTLEAFYHSVRHCPNLAAFGINCALGAAEMVPLVREIASFSDLPLIFYPNAGLPDKMGLYSDTPSQMALSVANLAREGLLNIAGGCCGTGPEHISAIARSLHGLKGRPDPARAEGLVVSGLDCFAIAPSRNFTNIGERTNVAGSRKFARLVASGDWEGALQVAAAQIEGGASVIDINMDDPMLDSAVAMKEFLRRISAEPEIAKVAVMIDSSHWETIAEALRNVQGKCIVNSISLAQGEREFLRKAQTIKSFGAAVVVMAFDEQGQATTYSRKIEICARSYRLLIEKAGFRPSDIIFDCNILSIGTGIADHARFGVDFIEAVRWVKSNLPGVRTSGGVSNLSFAFRGNNAVREAMHSVFLYHAVRAGLDMAIVNPRMLQIYDEIDPVLRQAVEDVIFDSDPEATSRLVFIASERSSDAVAKGPGCEAPSSGATSCERLVNAVIRGTSASLEADALEEMNLRGSAVAVVEGPLMEAMERVGDLFARGRMFLPQVVKSARTMREAVAVLQPYFGSGEASSGKPVFVIATVQGDVHDIGKNITSIVLQCSGFEVLDLGVGVPSAEIVEKAVGTGAAAIGLSGLITPSLHYMEEVCRMLADRGLHLPLFVGGAATSALHTAVRLAELYGDVFYCANASETAVKAKKALGPYDELLSQERASLAKIKSLYRESPAKDAVTVCGKPLPAGTLADIPLCEVPVESLVPLFDWKLFRAACRLEGETAGIEEAVARWLPDAKVTPKVCVRFFDCVRRGDDLVCDSFTIPFIHAAGSLLDFFPEGEKCSVGVLAASVGGDRGDDLVTGAMVVTLAEAAAEYARGALRGMLPEGFKIVTPGIGYPCFPDHSLKRLALSLLPEELGIGLTSSCAMIPEASICSLVIAHTDASYRDLRGVTAADIEEYSIRRGFSEEEKRIFADTISLEAVSE